MRILYLAADPVPAPKGAAVRIERTVRTLAELGHDVSLLTAATVSSPPLPGIDHHRVGIGHENFLERMMALRAAAAAWLHGRKADLVAFRSVWEGIPALGWARHNRGRVLYEAHGFPSVELPYHYPGLWRSPGLVEKLIREERAVLEAAHLVVTPSLTGRRFLMMRGVAPQRIAVVANAVDTGLFTPAAAPPPDEPPLRLVYQGTLAPWQGLGPLIEALAPFRALGGSVELHVVGPVKTLWRRHIRLHARRLRVHHMVHVSGPTDQAQLASILRTAHVTVAPLPNDPRNSLQGCCPIKILEYMSTGRPILATAIPPVEELLTADRDARLVSPGGAHALAQGIHWMRQHPAEREELGARARETALARFTPLQFRAALARALERLPG